jgi:hypothetical protein
LIIAEATIRSPVTDLEGHNAAVEEWRDASKRAKKVIEALSLEGLSQDGFDGVIDAMRECKLLSEDEVRVFLDAHKERGH